jgi:hypothetical protein
LPEHKPMEKGQDDLVTCGIPCIKITVWYPVTFNTLNQENVMLWDYYYKVKLSRYKPSWRLGWEEVQLLLYPDLSTRLWWVVSSMLQPRFTPGERAPSTHCTGSWVGTRASLDAETRGKILCPCRGSNPGHAVCSQSLYWLSYPAPHYYYRIQ